MGGNNLAGEFNVGEKAFVTFEQATFEDGGGKVQNMFLLIFEDDSSSGSCGESQSPGRVRLRGSPGKSGVGQRVNVFMAVSNPDSVIGNIRSLPIIS